MQRCAESVMYMRIFYLWEILVFFFFGEWEFFKELKYTNIWKWVGFNPVSIQFQLCHAFWQKITYQCKTDKGISYFLIVGLIKGMYDTQNFHCFLSFLRKYCTTPSEMLRAMYSLSKRRNPKPIQSGAAIAPTTETNFCTSLQNCSGASALDAPPLRRSYWQNTGHSPLRKL